MKRETSGARRRQRSAAQPKRSGRKRRTVSTALKVLAASRKRTDPSAEEARPPGSPSDGTSVGTGPSPTSIAAEALRTGVLSSARVRPPQIPHEDETIRVGDPDDSPLDNEYVGDDLPGGATSTPDHNLVDEIGRAYGLQDEDAGELHSGYDLLKKRDEHRAELRAPRRPRP